jgi:hypothetical protein
MNYTPEQIYIAKKEIVRAQVERFHEFYWDYFEKEETLAMVQYFFDKIYNLDGKKKWVNLAVNSFEKVKSIMKDSTRESVEYLMELNNLTDKLDEEMALLLLDSGFKEGNKITRDEYDVLYKKLGKSDLRIEQLKHVLNNIRQFYALAHRPINAVIMKPIKIISRTIGLYPLFSILEEGYHACLPVHLEIFESFVKDVEEHETNYILKSFPEIKK